MNQLRFSSAHWFLCSRNWFSHWALPILSHSLRLRRKQTPTERAIHHCFRQQCPALACQLEQHPENQPWRETVSESDNLWEKWLRDIRHLKTFWRNRGRYTRLKHYWSEPPLHRVVFYYDDAQILSLVESEERPAQHWEARTTIKSSSWLFFR